MSAGCYVAYARPDAGWLPVIENLARYIIRASFSLNNELRISIVMCRNIITPAGSLRWVVRLDEGLKPDITVAVRMDANNEGIRDYYLLPAIDMTWENLRIAEENGVYLDGYRFDTLDYFLGMAERIKFQEAA